MYRILLVEDDFALGEAVKAQIESWGNSVYMVEDFRDVVKTFNECKPHIVLMDIMLPFYNGYHWCNEIRKFSSVPIIFLSSASDNMNIVMAINMGGDDFVAKPFDSMVLNAKLQAMLRRTYELGEAAPILEFHGAMLDLNSGNVVFGDKTIDLTKNEFRILQTLLENKGKIVSRDSLMTRLWQNDCFVEENTLTVNVARLRKKLEDNGLPEVIKTKPGSGYIVE